ncbi:MAG TPA: hypothetical protein VG986_01600 [Pseudolabrys sp.]|nr:hypothetical protein [Pseudolabrys sp.]
MTLATLEMTCRQRHRYRAFGLHILSDLALPALAPADMLSGEPDVSIRVGAVPEPADAATRVWCEDGEIGFAIRGIARYRIRRGNEITVDPLPEGSSGKLQLFLLGSALGALCHQRGLLVLHANALVIDGRAIAFAGKSGAGKSTLVAHFHARGYPVLSDDTCVVSFDADGAPQVWPGLRQIKLWRDAAEHFGHAMDPQSRVVDGLEKYRVPYRHEAEGPFPLACIYVLGDAPVTTAPQVERLAGLQALNAIMSNTYRAEYLRRMGLRQRHFAQSLALANRVPVHAARYRRGLDVLAGQAAEFERHFHGVVGAGLPAPVSDQAHS